MDLGPGKFVLMGIVFHNGKIISVCGHLTPQKLYGEHFIILKYFGSRKLKEYWE